MGEAEIEEDGELQDGDVIVSEAAVQSIAIELQRAITEIKDGLKRIQDLHQLFREFQEEDDDE